MKKLGGYLALAVGVCLVGWLALQPVDDEGHDRENDHRFEKAGCQKPGHLECLNVAVLTSPAVLL